MRGGTGRTWVGRSLLLGLSPLARGNQLTEAGTGLVHGSIPACAGEPKNVASGISTNRVYPRLRGGTADRLVPVPLAMGLSPLARGNPGKRHRPFFGRGSIPACAGEPDRRPFGVRPARVYPRLRGGTAFGRALGAPMRGLSPLARGNLPGTNGLTAYGGSIPACAGEPARALISRMRAWVYPRLRGGTFSPLIWTARRRGLSPLARGNQHPRVSGLVMDGSIPACAGEPSTCAGRPISTWVYPRLRGGT